MVPALPNHRVHNPPSTLYHPSLSLIISDPTVEIHTLRPIMASPGLCMKNPQYALMPTLNYLLLLS